MKDRLKDSKDELLEYVRMTSVIIISRETKCRRNVILVSQIDLESRLETLTETIGAERNSSLMALKSEIKSDVSDYSRVSIKDSSKPEKYFSLFPSILPQANLEERLKTLRESIQSDRKEDLEDGGKKLYDDVRNLREEKSP